jgi:aminomethyltransferase
MSTALSSSPEVRRVPLDALHRALGARMGAFAGWDMPIQYPQGLKAEHLHTRRHAGLFDVSHMGQLRARARDGSGDTLRRALEAALPVDFEGWPTGLQRYSWLLNDAGGIEDDLMLVWLGAEVRLVVNAGKRADDLDWLQRHCPDIDFEWIDAALLALQGPESEAVLARLDPQAATMRFMESATLDLCGAACFTTRSGYTGEDGYEISVPLEAAERVARTLLEAPEVAPIGLGARDTLRLEAGLPLNGQDIGPAVTPVEAGLAFALPRSRRTGGSKAGGFPGADILLAQLDQGPAWRTIALVSSQAIPIRAGSEILDGQQEVVGVVTSGTVSPSLGQPILLARVRAGALDDPKRTDLCAAVRDKRPAVQRVPLPFVPKNYRR